MKNIAVILAGGTGSRVGAGIPKQFVEVFDKPILAYTLEKYQNNPNIDAIEIVVHPDWIEKVKEIVIDYNIDKTKWITKGGSTFQQSVKNGIYNLKGKILDEDIVVMTFGVSPMVSDMAINDSIRVCQEKGDAMATVDMTLCTVIKDEKDDEKSSTESILRERIAGLANPWTFKFGDIYDSYRQVENMGILDQLEPHTQSVYFALGKRIYFSKGDTNTCKITYKEDIDEFEAYLLLQMKREGKVKILEKGVKKK